MKALIRWIRNQVQKFLCSQIPLRHFTSVRFPHPIGIVIGDGVRLGRNVRIYQNVTIGLLETMPASLGVDRYPVIEDDVIVYAGAVIAGPICVGRGSVIGSNAVVTHDVPPDSLVVGHNKIQSRRKLAPPRDTNREHT